MSTHQIHVFISHAWDHSEHYNTLASWIFEEKWSVGQASLDFRDFSIPKNDPIHDAPTKPELKQAIFNKIARSHVIVIPTGVYATYSEWIQKEIDGAKLHSKPILAVIPRGQQRNSEVVLDNASDGVGWTKQSVIEGIWKLYRSL
jgi:hypothetical protein